MLKLAIQCFCICGANPTNLYITQSRTKRDNPLQTESEELALDIGDVLQLQFLPDESHARHYVKVIGYIPDKSLLVTTPHVNGRVMLVREGQRIAVRSMSGVNIIAFTANVLRSCARPYPYLHLSFPNDLQCVALRTAQRVTFDLEADVRDCTPGSQQSHTNTVKIDDMSTSGALLVSSHPLGDIKTLISVTMQLQVANAVEKFVTVAIIRNVRERQKDNGEIEYMYGIQFQLAGRKDEILLHAFVYEQMANFS